MMPRTKALNFWQTLYPLDKNANPCSIMIVCLSEDPRQIIHKGRRWHYVMDRNCGPAMCDSDGDLIDDRRVPKAVMQIMYKQISDEKKGGE